MGLKKSGWELATEGNNAKTHHDMIASQHDHLVEYLDRLDEFAKQVRHQLPDGHVVLKAVGLEIVMKATRQQNRQVALTVTATVDKAQAAASISRTREVSTHH